jgi:hypothetical protein
VIGPSRLAVGRVVRAKKRWRDAASLVWTRWETFLAAAPEARGFAFASYTAALDAEEAAAVALASLVSSPAAV